MFISYVLYTNNLTNLEIIMFINWLIDTAMDYHCIDALQTGWDNLPLLQFSNKIALSLVNFTCLYICNNDIVLIDWLVTM